MIKNVLYNPYFQGFCLFVVLVMIGYAGMWAYQNLRTTEYTDPDTRVSVRYSTRLVVERATAQRDRRDKILFRVRNREEKASGFLASLGMTGGSWKDVLGLDSRLRGNDKERRDDSGGDQMLVTVRYEDDLRKVSNTLRKDLLDILVENSEKVFQQEFIKYERISERRFEHRGHRAEEIVFTYLSPYGKFVEQRFMILIRDENTAFYLSAQATKERFDALNKRYFNAMFTSFGFK